MPIDETMVDASFLYRAVIAAVKAKNFDGAVDVAHSMSLLWKYVMILVDECLRFCAVKVSILVSIALACW